MSSSFPQPNDSVVEETFQAACRHHDAGNRPKAIELYKKVVAQSPEHSDALHLLGLAYSQDGEHAVASKFIKRAIKVEGGSDPNMYNDLGAALHRLGDLAEAAANYRRAAEIVPNIATVHRNLGSALHGLGKLAEAEASYRRAIEISPDQADAHTSLGLTLLLNGRFREGWEEHEWRFQTNQVKLPKKFAAAPPWQGDDLRGKTILLHAEQGFGDTIHFVRYASFVASKGGRVILYCQPALAGLLENVEGVEVVVPQGSRLPEFDLHCPLLGLPRLHGTSLDSIPAAPRYIFPSPDRMFGWKKRLEGPELKVGVVWAGSPTHNNDRNRSLSRTHLADLFSASGARFFSLQVGERASDIGTLFNCEVTNLAPLLTDFGETAAAIANLDLVISVDTVTAHLAAAIGKPVWLMLPHVPDWRWLMDGDSTPWYPTMRLYRQEVAGAWQPVLDRIRSDLVVRLQTHQLTASYAAASHSEKSAEA